jgi:xanthine dehydrogenase accessory factor
MSWLRALGEWPADLLGLLAEERAVARVVLASVKGSAPREPGVAMLVGQTTFIGTIGGGQLEWQAIAAARALLDSGEPAARVERLVLAADLGQCCGGVVELWIERYTRADRGFLEAAAAASRGAPVFLETTLGESGLARRMLPRSGAAPVPRLERDGPAVGRQRAGARLVEPLARTAAPVWLFGAGHVGQALARVLLDLPVALTWLDARAELLPCDLPGRVRVECDDPVESLVRAPPGVRYLVLTHSHELDYALCRAILARGDFGWVGLIGSNSKAARFRARLARDGAGAARIARLVCPIGVPGIRSKSPAAIAVAVAAQILQDLDSSADAPMSTDARISSDTDVCDAADCSRCGQASLDTLAR